MTGRTSGRTSARNCAAILGFAVFAGCCQSTSAQPDGPAVLARADDAAMTRIRTALEKEMGRSPIQLGPGDLTRDPAISVLPLPPGPPEDRSLATPTIFRLEIAGGACVLVREDTGKRIPLAGVACRAR
jgi:hypothetical protein